MRSRSDAATAAKKSAPKDETVTDEEAAALDATRAKMLRAEAQLDSTFVLRGEAIRVMLVAHLVREHYLLVGTPGTAKTSVATCFVKHIDGGTFFKKLLGAFITPDEIFGPLNIQRFTEDHVYERAIEGGLADVKYGFLDELLKAPDGTLNGLLGALNEREFDGQDIPLQTCGAATNWPEVITRTDNIGALYDRFLLRVAVEDVEKEDDMVKVLKAIDDVAAYIPKSNTLFTDSELEDAQAAVAQVPISDEVRVIMASLRTKLRYRHMADGKKKDGIVISSRRLGALQRVLRAAAWLRTGEEQLAHKKNPQKNPPPGPTEVTIMDFDILRFGLWSDQGDHEQVKAALGKIDALLVASLIQKIDQARTEYKNMSDSDFGTSRATQVTATIAEAVGAVKKAFKMPVFTTGGKAQVDKAMKRLAKDFKSMNEREQQFVKAQG